MKSRVEHVLQMSVRASTLSDGEPWHSGCSAKLEKLVEKLENERDYSVVRGRPLYLARGETDESDRRIGGTNEYSIPYQRNEKNLLDNRHTICSQIYEQAPIKLIDD